MTEIKLTYFDIAARGEGSRLALAIGKIPFHDDRIAMADWPALKPKTPYGQMPVINVEGKTNAQSMSILRFCGKKAGLYPECPVEALFVDEILDVCSEAWGCLSRSGSECEETRRKNRATVAEVDLPRLFGNLEKRLEGKSKWLVGDKVSIADLEVYVFATFFKTGFFDFLPEEVMCGYPKLSASVKAVGELPEVVEWNKKHSK